MQKARVILASLGAVAIAIVACGGSSSDNPPANTDAGTTHNNPDTGVVADTSVADTNVADTNVADTSVCVPDADLFTINPADAAIGDSGASIGTCSACLKSKCKTQLTTCEKDCTCASTVACTLDKCLGSANDTQAFITCGVQKGCISLSGGAGGIAAGGAILTCIQGSCATECDIQDGGTAPPPPADGGHDAADAKTD
jgi:hypothetical protein